MQLDWTTFLLEILNFVVLVWLLRHFFYRPVLAVLDARQARVRAAKAEAETLHRDAESLRTQYETRLAEWSKEREQAREQLGQQLAQERARRLDELKQTLADEEAKNRARSDAAIAAREAALCRQAVAEAYGDAAAMLRRLSSPGLTAQIVAMFCDDLATLAAPDLDTLRQAVVALDSQEGATISSAHALDDDARRMLGDAIGKLAGRSLALRFDVAPELIGGLRAAIGQCRLDASLADELVFFQRQAGHA